jgi:two-component system, LytTR family, sensor kinase
MYQNMPYFCRMKKELLFDIKAWVVVAILLPLGINAPDWHDKIYLCGITVVILIAVFYPHKWLIDNFLKKKKYVQYAFGLLLLISLSTAIFTALLKPIEVYKGGFWGASINLLLFIFFSTAISYGYKGIWLQIQVEKAKRNQVEAELKLLQSQVNPHFLFNTLNNIYAQNLINHEEANEMILQLSDLMRYQTQSASKNEVSLDEEIEFLENYIAVEKKRLTDKTSVSFVVDIPENITLMLPPMLFIPFVENAFKHGIGTVTQSVMAQDALKGVNVIDIHLHVADNHLVFDIKNTIPTRKQAIKSTKTGLENIKKRLDLLYPDRHNLDVIMENQMYHVLLKISL